MTHIMYTDAPIKTSKTQFELKHILLQKNQSLHNKTIHNIHYAPLQYSTPCGFLRLFILTHPVIKKLFYYTQLHNHTNKKKLFITHNK